MSRTSYVVNEEKQQGRRSSGKTKSTSYVSIFHQNEHHVAKNAHAVFWLFVEVPAPCLGRVKAVSSPYILQIKVPLYGAGMDLIRSRHGAEYPVKPILIPKKGQLTLWMDFHGSRW